MLLGLKWLQKIPGTDRVFFVTPMNVLNDFTILISKDGSADLLCPGPAVASPSRRLSGWLCSIVC
jgi:hypothetical protein